MSDNVLSVQPRPQDGLGLVPRLDSAPRPSGWTLYQPSRDLSSPQCEALP